MNNMIIGLGNCGTQIVKAASNSSLLKGTRMYCIDSQAASVDLNMVGNVTMIPIISDEKAGSGRNRERGAAMYKFHEDNGAFEEMYGVAKEVKSPVIVITSAAGGTGSGSTVPLCEALISKGIHVIPIIVCPSMVDPDAYHLNTNDLMIELAEVGIETYSIFRNSGIDADYTQVNKEVVELIEIIFGKRYDKTTLDSIDDSDMDVVLSTPGRFIAVSVSAPDVKTLKRDLVRKVFSGFQPAWNDEESDNNTFMKAYSLTSMFAEQDFKEVFEEIDCRIKHMFDEFRNIVNSDNCGVAQATVVIAGLPRAEIKMIDTEFKGATGIAEGMTRSKRPSFVNRKKASVTQEQKQNGDTTSAIKKFNWYE